jgi:hypothetical protein
MRRFVFCLPLFLFLAPSFPGARPLAEAADSAPKETYADKGPLPTPVEMEQLAHDNPISFLEQCLRYYDTKVKGYTTVMQKQERLGGKLQSTEVIDVAFREKPHSVFLRWVENPRRAQSVIYVAGENNGMMVVRPTGLLARNFIVERDPEGEEAKQSGRYSLKEYGMRKGMQRALDSWKAARERKELHVEYLGDVKVKEAGNRTCIALRRDHYARPEADGVMELTVYIDKETWLQVGSVLKDGEGKVIGAYYFRDVQLNPELKPEQFTRDALKP